MQHPIHFGCTIQNGLDTVALNQTEPTREFHVALEFGQRTERYRDVVRIRAPGTPIVALSDVGRH